MHAMHAVKNDIASQVTQVTMEDIHACKQAMKQSITPNYSASNVLLIDGKI